MHKADVTLQEGGPRKAGAVLCAIPVKGQPKKSCEMTGCRVQQTQAGLTGRQRLTLLLAPGERVWREQSVGWVVLRLAGEC